MMHFDVFVETIGALLDVEISADLSRPESRGSSMIGGWTRSKHFS